ncbi:type II restriction endonuclease [Psittacicella hinzii]|uniref:Restriction endonuclease n=1 Tax=Psittacicella hinzii TaxID=2028575 RepID=A0A3A1YQ23_9GAMM|nr:type II restriction endonuclease [Psittacicella hinzii]RIY39596.1 restriction endonuclease [Psittacicella hinzii]
MTKDFTVDEYKDFIKEERKQTFLQPYDLIYETFKKLSYHLKDKSFFIENASFIVEELRKKAWNDFLPQEKAFTTRMLKFLIDEKHANSLSSIEAITWFIEKYPEHIYALTLSNTQSRRSRAGKEFESTIELVLMGAGVPIDSQGNIGKQIFTSKGLGKMFDLVSPGAIEYDINKRNTVLISAKTTLRERWQEVPEEMGRTGAKEMFLATLDTTISSEVFSTLYEANIQVTTTKSIKENYYKDNSRVLTFEDLIKICKETASKWNQYSYSVADTEKLKEIITKQIQKHEDKEFVVDYYNERLKKY